MKTDYTVRLYSPDNLAKDWYVYIYSLSKKKIVKRFSEGINEATTFEDRMLLALPIKKYLENELSKGWEPNKTALPNIENKKHTICEAYEMALDAMYANYNLSKSTISHYKTHHRQFFETLKILKFHKVEVREFEPYHISLILEECQKKFDGTNDFYNKHLKSCKRIFKEMERKFLIKSNPAVALQEKEHKKKEKRLLTPEEYQKIIDYFEGFNPNFVTFIYCVELGIRPNIEARLLKFSMIKSLKVNDKKFFFFDIPAELCKNNKRKLVPIPPKIMERLPKIENYPSDFYIFGTPYKKAVGFHRVFVPSETALGHNAPNNIWREVVKNILGIDSDLYYLKSKSANDLRKLGVDITVIRDLFGHSNEEITRIYATEDYQVRMMEVAEKLNSILRAV